MESKNKCIGNCALTVNSVHGSPFTVRKKAFLCCQKWCKKSARLLRARYPLLHHAPIVWLKAEEKKKKKKKKNV
jgi:hypothetical protein